MIEKEHQLTDIDLVSEKDIPSNEFFGIGAFRYSPSIFLPLAQESLYRQELMQLNSDLSKVLLSHEISSCDSSTNRFDFSFRPCIDNSGNLCILIGASKFFFHYLENHGENLDVNIDVRVLANFRDFLLQAAAQVSYVP
jgi:hypothetical protein